MAVFYITPKAKRIKSSAPRPVVYLGGQIIQNLKTKKPFTNTGALFATRLSRLMATTIENTAVALATSKHVTEKIMTQEQFENEKKYTVSLHFVEQMARKKIITKEELEVCKQYLQDKYKPLIF